MALPRPFDPSAGVAVRAPERPEAGFWAGAPTVVRHDARWWLSYRERRPRGLGAERGWRAAIAVSDDGIRFDDVWDIHKDELGTASMERFALVPPEGPGEWTLYLSFVDPVDGRWRIDCVSGPDPARFDVATRRPVLTAASTGAEGVKDPVVVRTPGGEFLFVSYAAARPGLPADAHVTSDIFNVGATTHPTGLATRGESDPARAFTWRGEALAVGAGWDRYQARLGSVVAVDGGWLGFYDGSASHAENYEERLGIATSRDLRSWNRRTPDGPWLVGPGASGSVRYVSAHRLADGWRYYAEVTRPDGAHELRVIDVPDVAGEEGFEPSIS